MLCRKAQQWEVTFSREPASLYINVPGSIRTVNSSNPLIGDYWCNPRRGMSYEISTFSFFSTLFLKNTFSKLCVWNFKLFLTSYLVDDFELLLLNSSQKRRTGLSTRPWQFLKNVFEKKIQSKTLLVIFQCSPPNLLHWQNLINTLRCS